MTGGPAHATAPCAGTEDCIVVTVLGPSGFTQEVSITQINAWHDVQGPAFYRTRNPAGTTTDDPTVNQPLSVRELLGHLSTPIDPAAVTQVWFDNPSPTRPDAHTTPLVPSDLAPAQSDGFENGLMPAVFDDGNNSIGYIRPLRAGDPTDVNTTDDYLQTSPGEPLRMTVRTEGRLLDPRITATPATVAQTEPTRLSVTFPGNPDTTGWTYVWHFDDGSAPSTAATPTKAWAAAGRYDVTVDVTAPDTSSGQATLPVTVTGPPAPSPSPTPGTGGGSNSNPNAPHHGPREGSGSHTDQTPGSHAGASTPQAPGAQPTVAPAGGAEAAATQLVTGTVLVGADGRSVPIGTAHHDTLDLAPAGARSTVPGTTAWGWVLLAPLLLLVGGLAELRPWTRRRLAP